MLCVSFSSKSKAANVFPKHILKLKAHDQSIQARKKLFCCVTVKNYLCNILGKFLIKMEAHGGAKSKNRHLTLSYCGSTVRNSHQGFFIKIAVLKNFAIFTRKSLCWGLFSIKFFLKIDSNTVASCGYCKIFKTAYFEKHVQAAAS